MSNGAGCYPQRSERARSRVLPPVVAVAAFYIAAVALRLSQYDVIWFVHLGREMLEASNASSVITSGLGWQSDLGYDGQYYYALAVDPTNASEYMTDNAGIVHARPFYPALSRVVSLGQVEFVPYAMLLINLSAVVLGTLAIAGWLQRKGASPWFAVLFGLYPGLVYSVFRDLTEPLAWGLVAIAVWVFDRSSDRRVFAVAGILALAALTRETVVLFSLVAAIAVARTQSAGSGRRWSWSYMRSPVLFSTIAIGPLLLWKALITITIGEPAQGGPGGAWILLPFHGIGAYWPWDDEHSLIALTVVLPTLLAVLVSFPLFARNGLHLYGTLLMLNAAAFVVFLPRDVYVDYGAASRAAIGVVLATVICVPAWKADGALGTRTHLVSLAWALPWYLAVSTSLGVSGFDLITL